jgi:hypothetical protein
MSLKAFHIFFIVISFLFATYFGAWCFSQYNAGESQWMLLGTFGSFSAASALGIYLIWFLKRYKQIGFLSLAVLLFSHSHTLLACSVCLGDPNSPMVKSVNSGVVFLLGIVGGVLVGFAALFLFWRKREIQKMNLSAT